MTDRPRRGGGYVPPLVPSHVQRARREAAEYAERQAQRQLDREQARALGDLMGVPPVLRNWTSDDVCWLLEQWNLGLADDRRFIAALPVLYPPRRRDTVAADVAWTMIRISMCLAVAFGLAALLGWLT